MRIGVAKETTPGEARVALVPEGVRRLVERGVEVLVEAGAGARALARDEDYARAGATVLPPGEHASSHADVLVSLHAPDARAVAHLGPAHVVVAPVEAARRPDRVAALRARGAAVVDLASVPRGVRARRLDALRSQHAIAGWRAVVVAAIALPRVVPGVRRAGASTRPARVLVLGDGVAARAAVRAARELGAEVVARLASGASLADDVASADVVVAAVIEGAGRAPVLIDAPMIASMREGSVVVDLAAGQGGNVALTRPGERHLSDGGVLVVGSTNLASEVPVDASAAFSRALEALLAHLAPEGALRLAATDPITRAVVVAGGARVASAA
jgi:NAD(P) transhydrogenase subunit alpha